MIKITPIKLIPSDDLSGIRSLSFIHMWRTSIDLESICYDEKKFQSLVDILKKGSEDASIRIEVYDENGVREFEDVKDMFSNPFIPDNILKFALSVHTDRGVAKLRANGNWDKHILYLSGDDEWISGRKDEISMFIERNEFSVLRSYFDLWPRLFVISLGLGFLVSTQSRHVLYLFGIPIYYTYTVAAAIDLGIGISIISIAAFIHKLWPYVAIQKENSRSTGYTENLWKVIVAISIILGIVMPLIQIAERIG